ncbi:hypothetical protein, partial [Nocardia mangyaensis]|uniref:hypothetical protein n=1 Tax=Nocardia mangyaensis TaxID=2213200 RepID=UPI00267683C5
GPPAGDGVESDVFGGPCDPSEPDYYECLNIAGTMPDHTEPQVSTVGESFNNFYTEVKNAPLILSFTNMKNLISSGGSCSSFAIDLSMTPIGSVSTNIHCDLAEIIRPIIGPVMLIYWTICAFRIFASS